jgi:hypothetical protein
LREVDRGEVVAPRKAAKNAASSVDEESISEHQAQVRLLLCDLHLALQLVGQPHVVVIQEGNILTSGVGDRHAAGLPQAPMGPPQDPQAGVAEAVLDRVGTAIRRSIVDE